MNDKGKARKNQEHDSGSRSSRRAFLGGVAAATAAGALLDREDALAADGDSAPKMPKDVGSSLAAPVRFRERV